MYRYIIYMYIKLLYTVAHMMSISNIAIFGYGISLKKTYS